MFFENALKFKEKLFCCISIDVLSKKADNGIIVATMPGIFDSRLLACFYIDCFRKRSFKMHGALR